jgi:hypothetical protein
VPGDPAGGAFGPRISDLRRGKLDGFTLDRLVRFLNVLDQDVEVRVRPKQRATARLIVAR